MVLLLMLFTLPNLISFSRIPLAFLFLQESPAIRSTAIIVALLSDGLDGYLARRQGIFNKIGTLLDPFADKFFVLFAAIVLITEGRLHLWQVVALSCRDILVIALGAYLLLNKRLVNYQFRAVWCGKITTNLQFFTLLALSLNVAVPSPLYTLFILMGLLFFFELLYTNRLKSWHLD